MTTTRESSGPLHLPRSDHAGLFRLRGHSASHGSCLVQWSFRWNITAITDFDDGQMAHLRADLAALRERPLSPRQRIDFLTGRCCARDALRALGFSQPVAAIGRLASGAPRWPLPVTGSISHHAGLCAAALALANQWRGLGIDVQRWLTSDDAQLLQSLIVDSEEQAWLAELNPSMRAKAITIVFAIKEAAYKCLHGCGAPLRWHDLAVLPGQHEKWQLVFRSTWRRPTDAPTALALWVHTGQTHVWTFVGWANARGGATDRFAPQMLLCAECPLP